MSGHRIVILGATGMVGGLVLQRALEDDEVVRVTSVARRATGVDHAKLHEVPHEDFGDYTAVADQLDGQDAALFCLGAYTGAVPDEQFRRITVDFAVAFAEALHARSPGASFCLLSGQGADRKEKSRMAFARYKGIAENRILALQFARTHVFRPGYIYPVAPRSEPNLSYRILRAVYPAVEAFLPRLGIRSDELASAMLDAALHGTPGHDGPILEHRDIHGLVEGATSAKGARK